MNPQPLHKWRPRSSGGCFLGTFEGLDLWWIPRSGDHLAIINICGPKGTIADAYADPDPRKRLFSVYKENWPDFPVRKGLCHALVRLAPRFYQLLHS